ncbi:MAG: outer membrane beta-barrel protein [Bacteroidota bacterium]
MRPLRFALFAAFFAAAPLAHAQLIPSFGVTGGLNFGSLSDAGTADLDQSTGYHVGIFGDFGFGPLAARASVLFVRAGDIELVPTFQDSDAGVSYIAVPIDLQYRFPSPLLKPYALVGPEFRFATGDLADLDGSRSTSVAVNVGVGAQLAALIGPKVFAELRYAFDVSGFLEEREAFGITVDDTFRVNVFFLRVGIGL